MDGFLLNFSGFTAKGSMADLSFQLCPIKAVVKEMLSNYQILLRDDFRVFNSLNPMDGFEHNFHDIVSTEIYLELILIWSLTVPAV